MKTSYIAKPDAFQSRCLLILLSITALFTTTGCVPWYQAGDQNWSGSTHIWTSEEHRPATLSLFDSHTNEVLWTMDIPPGKCLATKFIADKGHDSVYRSDRLEYQIFDKGTKFGTLRSAVSVPNAEGRRWELTIRDGSEYADPDSPAEYRAGKLINNPDWWQESGGLMPDKEDNNNDGYGDM